MNNKRNLLEMKRNLIALTLTGSCLLGLGGCSIDTTSKDEPSTEPSTADLTENIKDKNDQFLCIYDDKAVIIEPYNYKYSIYGSNYVLYINNDDKKDMRISMNEAIMFTKNSSLTAEEYLAIVKGTDFPIEYIRSEDYNKSR